MNTKAASIHECMTWLLFKNSHLPACLTRIDAFEKATDKRDKSKRNAPTMNASSYVETMRTEGFTTREDDHVYGIIAIVRSGSRVEKTIEKNISEGLWNLVYFQYPLTRNHVHLVSLPASVHEQNISVLVGVEKDEDITSARRRVTEIIGDPKGRLEGDILLERVGVVRRFSNPTHPLLTLSGNESPKKWNRETSRIEPTHDYAEKAFEAWKHVVPRRFRVADSREFAIKIAEDIETYMNIPEIIELMEMDESKRARMKHSYTVKKAMND